MGVNTMIMPNQRNPGKSMVGAWVPKELHKQLKDIAKREKVDAVSDLVHEMLREQIERYHEKKQGRYK